MANLLGIDIVERTHENLLWDLRLPDALRESFGVSKTRWKITFDRMLAARNQDWMPINMDNWFFRHLLDIAVRYDFGGTAALTDGLHGQALFAGVARWQNDRGRRARQELALISIDSERARLNPAWASEWLATPRSPVNGQLPDRQGAVTVFELAAARLERMLADQAGRTLLPDQPQWLAGGWQTTAQKNPQTNASQETPDEQY